MEYSFSNITGDDNLVQEEAFDRAPMKVFGTESPDQLLTAAAAADWQIENNFSLKDVIEEITETLNGRTKTDIGDGQNSSVDETETVDDDNEGRVENPNALNDIPSVEASQLGYVAPLSEPKIRYPNALNDILSVEASQLGYADETPIAQLGYVAPLSEPKIRYPNAFDIPSVEASQVGYADETPITQLGYVAPLSEPKIRCVTMQVADHDECLKNKQIFFYGGKDEWIQEFVKKATALANDLFLKDFDINIELYHVEEKARGQEHPVQKFRDHLKGLLSGKDKKQVEPLTKMIEKLLSDDPNGWAVLSKDSKNPITRDRKTFLRVIEEFDQWKKNLVKNRFDLAFKNYYDEISPHVSTAAGK